jgi:glucan phosphoethanolaminetransferase (alkaline phosphatase superfamily)
MLKKSISPTVSEHRTRRRSHVPISYWISTVLIIVSTVIHGICCFTSNTWLVARETTNKSRVLRFRSEDICLEKWNQKVCCAPYLPVEKCNATDVSHWIIGCSKEHVTFFNQSSPGRCHCTEISSTRLMQRHSTVIWILLVFASLIALARLCAAEECLLRYLHKHLLSILLVCVIALEFHLVYAVFQEKRRIGTLLQTYFPVHDLYFSWFYSFQWVSILNHTTLIVILISCS